jgi:DNA-binding transcriptional ArsR family regulator
MKEKNPNQNTTRKTTIIGTEQYINASTGVIEDFNVIRSQDSDYGFDKLWAGAVLMAFEEFGNQKSKLLVYLFRIRERSNNAVIKTIAELAEETGMNRNTVSSTLQILERHGIVTRKTGVIFLSPNVIFRGSHSNRMRLLLDFERIQKNQDEDEEQKLLKPASASDLAAIPGLAVKNKKRTKTKIKPANAGV